MADSTVNQRLAFLIKEKKISQAALAKTLSITPQSVSALLSGETKPRFDVINAILSVYTDVSPDWLISGEGGMYRKTESGIPYYDIEAIAGQPATMLDATQTPISYINVPDVTGELALTVQGESMLPVFRPGDMIVCRRTELMADTVFAGFYVVCFDDSIVIKSVRWGSEGVLHLISRNPDYPIIEIPAAKVTQLYKVVCKLQLTTF